MTIFGLRLLGSRLEHQQCMCSTFSAIAIDFCAWPGDARGAMLPIHFYLAYRCHFVSLIAASTGARCASAIFQFRLIARCAVARKHCTVHVLCSVQPCLVRLTAGSISRDNSKLLMVQSQRLHQSISVLHRVHGTAAAISEHMATIDIALDWPVHFVITVH